MDEEKAKGAEIKSSIAIMSVSGLRGPVRSGGQDSRRCHGAEQPPMYDVDTDNEH